MPDDDPLKLKWLRLVLWVCWAVSGIGIPFMPFLERDERIGRAHYSNQDGIHDTRSAGERQSDLIWQLKWGINPASGYPTCFVLSTGFLCLVYTLEGIRRRLPAPTVAPVTTTAAPPPLPDPGPPARPIPRKPAGV